MAGIPPAKSWREKAAETFGRHLPQFLVSKRAELKPQSFSCVDRFLSVYAQPWHGRALDSIDRRVVAIRLSEIAAKHGPGAANRFRSALSNYFAWLIGAGLTESNPVTGTNKAPGEGGARTRLLDDGELAAIWRAAGSDQFGSIVRLLILTGARREEIGGLRWSEIDLDRAVILLPGERTNNSREHLVALSPAAISILEAQPRRLDPGGASRDLIFGHGDRAYSGWSKSRRELDVRLEAAGTPVLDFVLHDFRRALSTWLHEAGFPPRVVERLLGHLQPGVGRVYNAAEYLEERRRALEKWAGHIEEITTGKPPATVVQLRR
ncbi:site-specific integrase [Bradyrhizobium lablabi]|uniref:tyrosine-type recombinase/integrase n=1 Tax=Bradyrhizobium lablabi TaxID=722472 RepID=UPI001BA6D538|nr:site-specific integrase [Bradyrhizobium lablabi]MBR0694066.1 site-specific integrase [Bradyrhizobium lablabi]